MSLRLDREDSPGAVWVTYEREKMLTVTQQNGTFGNWSLSQRGFMQNKTVNQMLLRVLEHFECAVSKVMNNIKHIYINLSSVPLEDIAKGGQFKWTQQTFLSTFILGSLALCKGLFRVLCVCVCVYVQGKDVLVK